MSYDNTAALMSAGMKCLRDGLGVLESEIFIATIKAEDIDYTTWRQSQHWVNIPLDEAIDNAVNFVNGNPGVIPKNATVI
jgi:hypothetical protein